MMNINPALRILATDAESDDASVGSIEETHLDQVFGALSDPTRRRILEQLDGKDLLVSEIAAGFNISLQGVSRHIQVLVRAGLVQQARSGRISRCTLEAAPLLEAAVWLNRYAKYWQGQFDLLAVTLAEIDERRAVEALPAQLQSAKRAPTAPDGAAPAQPQSATRAPTVPEGATPAQPQGATRAPTAPQGASPAPAQPQQAPPRSRAATPGQPTAQSPAPTKPNQPRRQRNRAAKRK